MSIARSGSIAAIALLSLTAVFFKAAGPGNRAYGEPQAQAKPGLEEEEMRQFLLTAKVIAAKRSSKGVTRPYRLTLSDGRLTQDAGFQSIDVRKSRETMSDGTVEVNFRDSYHFNIAAFEIARLVGLGPMMPVTVERKWEGKTGSLTWWPKVVMDEKDRREKDLRSPDAEAWNRQMYRKRVFANLAGDRDPNLTNVLIDENWKIYMIDFTRAFRLVDEIEESDLERCDRLLLEELRGLDRASIERAVRHHLNRLEVDAVLKRRDKIVAHFEQLVARQGEDAVLY